MNKGDLDCVLIGYHYVSLEDTLQDLEGMRQYSGGYWNLVANSVAWNGKRMSYTDLLNLILEKATGQEHHLHVAHLPNLAVCYLKSFLNKRQINAEVVNFFTHEKRRLEQLLACSPAAVAITTTFYSDNQPIVDIINFVRQINPDIKIIVGGPYIYNSITSVQGATKQDYILKSIGADIYVVDTQGEHTLYLLLSELRKGSRQDLSRVPNLIYTPDNQVFYRTTPQAENNSLDENSIEWQFFERDFYTPTVQMRTARGCAFSCAFCRYPIFAGPLTLADPKVVESEMKSLQAAGVKNIIFIDDTFNVPLPRFKELCRMMIRNRFGFNWISYFRCGSADEETFDLMRESGCLLVHLGIESGDQEMLARMNKSAKVDKYADGVRKLKERGIITSATVIVGFPGETEASVQKTVQFLDTVQPTLYRAELYYHSVLTPIHEQAKDYGIKGAGYSWRHNTMDWRQATQLIEGMYTAIHGPVIMPIYNFDFWSIPYLMGKGFSSDQIIGFTKVANEVLLEGFRHPSPDTTEHEKRLLSLFKR